MTCFHKRLRVLDLDTLHKCFICVTYHYFYFIYLNQDGYYHSTSFWNCTQNIFLQNKLRILNLFCLFFASYIWKLRATSSGQTDIKKGGVVMTECILTLFNYWPISITVFMTKEEMSAVPMLSEWHWSLASVEQE